MRLVPPYVRPDLRGVWLVLMLCAQCRADTEYYCSDHAPRRTTSRNTKAAHSTLDQRSSDG